MRHLLVFALAGALTAQTSNKPVRAVSDPGIVTTRQSITPAGVPNIFKGRVYGVAFGESSSEIFVLNGNDLFQLDWRANKVIRETGLGGGAGLQAIRYDSKLKAAVVAESTRDTGIQLTTVRGDQRRTWASDLGRFSPGALDVAAEVDSAGRRVAVLPLIASNKVAIIDLEGKAEPRFAATGIAPFGAAVARNGSVAYVSNWGGRLARNGDMTAPTGTAPNADKVVVDERGVANNGTVSRIDLNTLQTTHTIAVGLHPTAIAWDEARGRVYVANNNSDTVSEIDSRTQAVTRTLDLQVFAQKVRGIAPTALALAPGGQRLYVACGGINAVVVMDLRTGRVDGMIPTAWYPNALAMSPDGTKLAVTALLGAGSGWRESPSKRFVHANRGSVAVIDVPDVAQLASYTTVVAENNHLPLAGSASPAVRASANAAARPIPHRSGEPSTIEHVVFIIKENRTYDQVFGDIEKGNGDPSLVMFGRDITPNQHKMAEEFVLLDNLYATGGNSADGHQWVTQASENAYCMWPGYQGRSYPFDGTDPLAYASGGFLWDYALAAKKTVRVYGEYVGSNRQRADRKSLLERWKNGDDFSKEFQTDPPIARMKAFTAPNYPAYTTAIPDVVRASIFMKEFKEMEQDGKMPNLTFLQLPSNHTNGTSPNASTPQAMCADNDLALGQIVEALSKSKFWPKMAIFVIEDDAQNGVDHVDGHRTAGLIISPYTKRGAVDSTFYSTQSMVKSIELILGLPTMSLFDLIAFDMRNSFMEKPDLTPYSAVEPKQSLFDRNPQLQGLKGPAKAAAIASSKMRWSVPDAVPTEKLNRILWGQSKGWNSKYPGARNAVFSPLSLDIDDDDRE
ncbi:MAG: bifunctional YncE family protein/alkaline phosphatase family protein [Bryobacteraceae bacterium]|nr:bifunctional YncE family protein/alkaline phosphatase family protein [Bryobacteraceae bacterium]